MDVHPFHTTLSSSTRSGFELLKGVIRLWKGWIKESVGHLSGDIRLRLKSELYVDVIAMGIITNLERISEIIQEEDKWKGREERERRMCSAHSSGI